ncbi:MAG: sigma-E factor negative regulatory protein [Gammaproteobacteria bacterium]|jgi:sigma-E factor negative regulatory protein RseA
MNELNKEQLSAFIDGEHETDHILDKLIHDEEMKQTWSRYHLIGDCLRDNIPEQVSNQVSQNISQALQNEPTVLAPTKKRFDVKPLAGLAIAASVAMVAVFTIQTDNDVSSPVNNAPAVANVVPSQVTPAQTDIVNFSQPQALPAAVTHSDTPDSIANERLNNYLLNHNEYRSNAGVNGIMPHVRMVTIETQE